MAGTRRLLDLPGKIEILNFVEMVEYGLARVECFGASGAPRQIVQTLLNIIGETNCEHCYTNIAQVVDSKKPGHFWSGFLN